MVSREALIYTEPEPDLASVLEAATAKLDRICQQIEADEDGDLAHVAPELQVSERSIRTAAARMREAPSAREARAYRLWIAASAHFRRVAHRRLEDLDEKMFSVCRCSAALRACGGFQSHHRARHQQRQLESSAPGQPWHAGGHQQ